MNNVDTYLAVWGNGTDQCYGDNPGVAGQSQFRTLANGPYQDLQDPNDVSNFTNYENDVKYAHPYLLVGMQKNLTYGENPDAWGDVRLICPTPDQVQAGSREVEVPSAAMSWKMSSGATYAAVLVSFFVASGLV